MRFEGIEKVWMKLVDTDVKILPSDDGAVHVEASPDWAFSLKTRGKELSILTSTRWKLKNFLKKEKDKSKLVMRVPWDVEVSGGLKKAPLHAKGVRFDSLAVGGAPAELRECEVGLLTAGMIRGKASIYVTRKSTITLAMGSLEVRVLSLDDALDVSTAMGSINLYLPEDCDARIEPAGKEENIILKTEKVLGSGMHRVSVSSAGGRIIVDTWGDLDDI